MRSSRGTAQSCVPFRSGRGRAISRNFAFVFFCILIPISIPGKSGAGFTSHASPRRLVKIKSRGESGETNDRYAVWPAAGGGLDGNFSSIPGASFAPFRNSIPSVRNSDYVLDEDDTAIGGTSEIDIWDRRNVGCLPPLDCQSVSA